MRRFQETLFLQGADSLGAELHLDLLAIDDDGLGLKIWLPDFLGMALREGHVVPVLLAFAGEITFLHRS